MDNLTIQDESIFDGKIHALHLAGDLDTRNSAQVEKAIRSIMDRACFLIILDLSGMDYISSSGWGAFLSELSELRSRGGDVVLYGLSDTVQKVHDMMGFGELLKVFPDCGKAEAYLRSLWREPLL